MGKLNPRQEKFCQEYLIDLNGTQAAIRAGYSKKTARSIANENLTKPDIQNYIQELQKGTAKRNQITRDEIVQDLIEVKNRCLQNVPVMYFDKIDKCWKHEGADIGEPVYKFDPQGVIKALDVLCKITGAYNVNLKIEPTESTQEAFLKHLKELAPNAD